MIELDQPELISKKKKNCEELVNGELFSCAITDSGRVCPERVTYKTLPNYFS